MNKERILSLLGRQITANMRVYESICASVINVVFPYLTGKKIDNLTFELYPTGSQMFVTESAFLYDFSNNLNLRGFQMYNSIKSHRIPVEVAKVVCSFKHPQQGYTGFYSGKGFTRYNRDRTDGYDFGTFCLHIVVYTKIMTKYECTEIRSYRTHPNTHANILERLAGTGKESKRIAEFINVLIKFKSEIEEAQGAREQEYHVIVPEKRKARLKAKIQAEYKQKRYVERQVWNKVNDLHRYLANLGSNISALDLTELIDMAGTYVANRDNRLAELDRQEREEVEKMYERLREEKKASQTDGIKEQYEQLLDKKVEKLQGEYAQAFAEMKALLEEMKAREASIIEQAREEGRQEERNKNQADYVRSGHPIKKAS